VGVGVPLASIALYLDPASLTFGDGSAQHLQLALQQKLIEQRLPFDVIHERQAKKLSAYRCVVLAGCESLSDDVVGHIGNFFTEGGELIALGAAGTRDQWRRERAVPCLEALNASRAVFLPAGAIDELVSRLKAFELWHLETSSRRIVAAGHDTEKERVLNLANAGEPIKDLRLWISCRNTPEKVELAIPGKDPVPQEFTWDNGKAWMTLAELGEQASITLGF
jgi:hypothetical protein